MKLRSEREGYWRERLAGFDEPTPLGIDRPPRSGAPARYERHPVAVAANIYHDLSAVWRTCQTTASTVMHGLWGLLLSRYSGRGDVVFGSVTSGRPVPRGIGPEEPFIHAVPVRVEQRVGERVTALLRRLHDELWSQRDHEHDPLWWAQAWSEVPGGQRLFESLLVLENVPVDAVGGTGEGGEGAWRFDDSERLRYPLALVVTFTESSLGLCIDYDRGRFDASAIERLGEHLVRLMTGFAAAARGDDRALADLDLLSAEERNQLVVGWNETGTIAEVPMLALERFDAQVAERADSIAVSADAELTYEELDERARHLAGHLRALGVGPEVRVALLMERSANMVAAILGVLKAGGTYVPMSPELPVERLAYMLSNSGARVLIRDRGVDSAAVEQTQAEVVTIEDLLAEACSGSPGREEPVVDAGQGAYVIYTSGSSGRPKGVVISHGALANMIETFVGVLSLSASDRVSQVASFVFDASVFESFPCLSVGATLVMAPTERVASAPDLWEWLALQRVSVCFAPTPLAEVLMGLPAPAGMSLRALYTGGDQLRSYRPSEWSWALHNFYGPTENTVFASTGLVGEAGEGLPRIGRPVRGVNAYALDAELRPVPIGVAGELYLGGEQLARGYTARPDLTAKQFQPCPFTSAPGRRMYRTGDLVRWTADGELEFWGRIDHQVKVRGYRIELGEIEASLLSQEGISEAVVVVRALGGAGGSADKRLVAYVVPAGVELSIVDLRERLGAQLPDYMVPSAFVMLDALPLTTSGKVDRNALPAPGADAFEHEAYAAPRTESEVALARIWVELLAVDRVGLRDSFLHLGGDSLQATQLVSRVRDAFGVELSVAEVFDHPRLSELATLIDAAESQAERERRPAVDARSRLAGLPLSFAQERLWFLDQMLQSGGERSVYSELLALRLEGVVSEAALRGALTDMIARHEALRTRIESLGGAPVARVARAEPVLLPIIDVSGEADPDEEAVRIAARSKLEAIDLAEGPLLRARLVRMAPQRHLLALVVHHIVTDGWSVALMAKELASFYNARLDASASPLAPMSIQYGDYAAWQREWLTEERLSRQVDYWKRQLDGSPSVIALPTDRPRPAIKSHEGAEFRWDIDAELISRVRAFGDAHGVSPFMTLLAAFQVLLGKLSDQDDFVVGTPIANRVQTETEDLMGFFVNTLALRADLSGDPTLEQVLERVRGTALEAYAHQDLPFEKLVEVVSPERSLSYQPVFQVMFALQNAPEMRWAFDGLVARDVFVPNPTCKFDLELVLWPVDGGIEGNFAYSTEIFDEATIRRLADYYVHLVHELLEDPTVRVSEVALEPDAIEVAHPEGNPLADELSPVHELFAGQVTNQPGAAALRWERGTLSYAELDERVEAVAQALSLRGVGVEDRVCLLAKRGPHQVAAVLGILRSGATYVPLDPDHPGERRAHIVGQVSPRLVLVDATLEREVPDDVDVLRLTDLPAVSDRGDYPRPSKDNAAYVMFTSGSTGLPKGVVVSHGAICNMVLATQRATPLDVDDVYLQLAACSFDLSLHELLWPLSVGASLVIIDSETQIEPARLAATIREHRVSCMHPVPSMMRVLLPELAREPAPSIRLVLTGGEALTADVLALFRRVLPGALLTHNYGPTETTVLATTWRCEGDGHIVIGRPYHGTHVHVLDSELRPVAIGVPGEMCIGGAQVARGYHGRPDLTAERFVPDPFATSGARMYRTGDLVRKLADGSILFLGRVDRQVKIRGCRIEMGEVEAAINEVPGVAESTVVARTEGSVGGVDARLVAYVVPTTDESRPRLEAATEHQRELFDEVYQKAAAYDDPTFNIDGWNSLYTREPIPADEMRAWVDGTVARCLEGRPKRILELGVGTGLLLFPLAPTCQTYVATDFSAEVVEHLRRYIDRCHPELAHVRLACREALDLAGLAEDGPFDLVIVNSVVQYFPGVSYLDEVLRGAIALTRDGGRVFFGDIRDLRFRDVLHTSVQLFSAEDDTTIESLAARAGDSARRDPELLLDPRYFVADRVRSANPRIAAVECLAKPGTYDNELSRYRCDVIVHVDSSADDEAPPPRVLTWGAEVSSVDDVRVALASAGANEAVLVQGVPSARLDEDRAIGDWMASAPVNAIVEELRTQLRARSSHGVEPEALVALSTGGGLSARAGWFGRSEGTPFSYDVLFSRRLPHAVPEVGLSPRADASGVFAQNLGVALADLQLVPGLRAHLEARLPDYMVPSAFVVLGKLPLTRSGKIDQRALPLPQWDQGRDAEYQAPQTVLEQRLAAIWSELLGVPRVGLGDSFFALGGHSLLAMRLIARVRDELALEVPVSIIFDADTLGALARAISTARLSTIPQIGRRDDLDEYPLSHAQERLWFLDRLRDGQSNTYNLEAAWRLRGPLDREALERALSDIVNRHEVLRARISVDGEQTISPVTSVHLDVTHLPVELDAADPEEVDKALRAEISSHFGVVFSLAEGPLFRAGLCRVSPDHNVFWIVFHHIVFDGWSLQAFARELATLYGAYRENREPSLPPLSIQYADYAVWQRTWLEGGEYQRQLSYWSNELRGMPELLELPLDHPRPTVQNEAGASYAWTIAGHVREGIGELANALGVTPFMVKLAAFEALLYRYTHQKDFGVGTVIAGRGHQALDPLLGFFVNTLVIRAQLDDELSFADLVRRVERRCRGAYAHQELPFEKLVEELAPERNLGHSALFQVLFTANENVTLELPGLSSSNFEADISYSNFELMLDVGERDGTLRGDLWYQTALFEPSTIERLAEHYGRLLEAAIADPQVAVSRMPLLSEAELDRVLALSNDTGFDVLPPHRAHARFEAMAAEHPEAVALAFDGREMTYGEMNALADAWARQLQEAGVVRGSLVGVCAERSFEMVVSLYAVLKAGGGYVPLDPSLPSERLAYMTATADVAAILCHRATREVAGTLGAGRGVPVLVAETLNRTGRPASIELSGEDLAYAMFTSGSTGRPKGVVISHGALANMIETFAEVISLSRSDRVAQVASFVFDASVSEIFPCLSVGATLVLAPPAVVSSAPGLWEWLALERVSVCFVPTPLAEALMGQEPSVDVSLRALYTGGDQLRSYRPAEWTWDLHNVYGPTENTVFASIGLVGESGEGLPSIGPPVGRVRTYVLDRELRAVPIGVAGELFLSGGQLGRGYAGRPDLTAERFVPCPFSAPWGGRMYRTGDRVRWNVQCELEFLGRLDHQVKVRGYRIEPGEVESSLLSHANVSEAVVMARGGASPEIGAGGGGGDRLVAYVVPAGGEAQVPSVAELREHLGSKLPAYMVPSAFVVLDALPLTTSGKVDRKALPDPDEGAFERDEFESPRTEVEHYIAELWSELLGVAQIGIRDNFFLLGGHSLLVTKLVSRIREHLKVEVPVESIFRAPTLAALAETIEARRSSSSPRSARVELCRRSDGGTPPLSYAQQRLWFIDRLKGGGSSTYNMGAAWRVAGALDHSALERAFNEVVARHEVLRTTISAEGAPIIAPPRWVELPLVHLGSGGGVGGKRAVGVVTRELGVPFDLERGPLWRAGLVRVSADEHFLWFDVHHIAFDGWSYGVFFTELDALYQAFVAGRESPLAELPVQYADYAAWHREWMEEGEAERQLAYWKEALAGMPDVLELPVDRPRPHEPSDEGARVSRVLSPTLLHDVAQLAHSLRVTPFIIKLAAFQALLYRYCQQDDFGVGTVIAGRNHQALEGLVGFFVNTLVIRAQVGKDTTFADLVKRVETRCRGAYSNQDVPFERLVDELAPTRRLSHSPLFQVVFLANDETPLSLAGAPLSTVAEVSPRATFDLTLNVGERDGHLEVEILYRTELFERATIERMAAHFAHFLAVVVTAPETRVASVEFLSAAERRQVLVEWNATGEGSDTSVVEALVQHAAERPDAEAVTCSRTSLSFAQLDRRANALASLLRREGIRREERVGVLLPASSESIVAYLAVWKAGGAYMPLSTSEPIGRTEYKLEHSGARVIVTDRETCPIVSGRGYKVVLVEDAATERTEVVRAAIEPDQLAYVIFTSGSTGRPKGVGVSHRNLCALTRSHRQYFEHSGEDRLSQVASHAFDAAVAEIWPALVTGASVHLVPDEARDDPSKLWRWLAKHRITVCFAPTPMMEALLDAPRPDDLRLRCLQTAGDRLVRRPEGLGIPLYNLYGPTENTVWVSGGVVDETGPSGKLPHIGRPVMNVRAYVVDADLIPVPVGVPGELYVAGKQVARGYLGRPDLTAERFVPCPFSADAGTRMYRTGDGARWLAGGNLEYLGRRDHQVKVRGYRIEPGEIESSLLEHPAVAGAVVVAAGGRVRDAGSLHGGADATKQLVAYVVPAASTAGGLQPSIADLRAHLGQRLPEYMVPSAYVFLDSLPLTSNGKLDRAKLPEPKDDAFERNDYVAPRSEAEKILAGIWSEVLGVARVGIHDNFFSLGGDSILSIQVVNRARARGVAVSVRSMFSSQTIAELSSVAEQSSGVPAIEAEQGLVVGDVPFSPIQAWLLERVGTFPDHYNQANLYELDPALKGEVLREALVAVVSHHDALRLRVWRDERGRWLQSHRLSVDEALAYSEERLGREVAHGEGWEALCTRVHQSLSLDEGPLVRAVRYRIDGETRDRLLIVIHHMAVDAVSWSILEDDLELCVQQLLTAAEINLPPKSTSYKSWCERLDRSARTHEGIEDDVRYWSSADFSEAGELPRGSGPGGERLTMEVVFEPGETDRLLRFAHHAYRTETNDLLLAALARTLCQWSGHDRVVVGLEGHGREDLFEDVDVTRTVGWFTSLFPVRLEGRGDLGSTIKTTKEALRSIPHRGLGYGILRYLGGGANGELPAQLSKDPEVVFNYLGQVEHDGATPPPGARDGARPREHLISLGFGPGRALGPDATRSQTPITVTAVVSGGVLRVQWSCDSLRFSAADAGDLAHSYRRELCAILDHTRGDTRLAYTPSDFPLATLSQAELDRVVPAATAVDDIYPLAPLQEGLLFHALKEGSYVTVTRLNLRGGVREASALREAVRRLVARYDILRARIVWRGVSRSHQVIETDVDVPWTELDWREFAAAEQSERLDAFADAEQRRPFEMAAAPLLRLTAVRLSDDSWEIIWSQHHVILDGWSLGLLSRDLRSEYQAVLAGTSEARPASRPYRDYLQWLGRKSQIELERYWRARLAGLDARTPLSIVRGAEGGSPERREVHAVPISEPLSAAVAALARERRTTVSTIVHAAWALVLSRYSGQREVLFGSVTSGRPAELVGVESMVGCFINTLPVRVDVDGSEAVGRYLERLHGELWSQRDYEYVGLSSIAAWSQFSSGQPLFDSLVVFENYPVNASDADEHVGLTFQSGIERSHYPLVLVGVEEAGHLELGIGYDLERVDPGAIERLTTHLINALQGLSAASADAGLTVAGVELLSEAERRQLLIEWQGAPATLPEPEAVHRCFEAIATKNRHAVALLMGDRSMTYGELDDMANRLARHLQDAGVVRGSRVGVCFERSFELVASLLAVLKAGGVYVPLDPSLPAERLAYEVVKADLSAALGHRVTRTVLAPLGVTALIAEDLAVDVADPDPVEVCGSDAAYVIFTSGSTGRPKGVEVSHHALLNVLIGSRSMHTEVGSEDGFIAVFSQSFDASVKGMLWPLTIGARLVLVDDAERRDPDALIRAVKRHHVAVLPAAPSMVRSLMATAELNTCTSLRVILTGTEAISMELVREVRAVVPWVHLRNSYGPTETTVVVSQWRCDPEAEQVLIGKPWPNTALFVLDEDYSTVPIGVSGELFVAGAQLARGYVDEPGQTAAAFVPCPHSLAPGGRMYRTGDLARWTDQGHLEFRGRIDHQVKVRGYRIELGEIESALREHAGVEEAVVVATDAARGRADRQLVAYVIPASETSGALSIAELREHLGERLPDYMVPSAFVRLDALPLAASGKLDRKALPAPSEDAFEKGAYVAPRNETERILAELWSELLGVSGVGVHDNFFSLGGDSIMSIQLVSRARDRGVLISVRDMFSYQTIAELAAHAEASTDAPPVDAEQGLVVGDVPLTPSQQAFFAWDSPAPSHFNQSMMFEVPRSLSSSALAAVASAVAAQHDVFRLRYVRGEDGAWRQRHVDLAADVLPCEEVTVPACLSDEDRFARYTEVHASLDLSAGPVARLVRFREQGAGIDLLLFVAHQLVVDAVSWSILHEDLNKGLSQALSRQVIELGAKTTSFKAWAERLARAGAGVEGLEEDAAYWRALDTSGVGRLPTHDPAEGNLAGTARASEEVVLDRGATETLLLDVPVAYRTDTNDVLLTALARVLCRVTGGDDALIAVEGHGREDLFADVDLSRTVGSFTSVFPIVIPGTGALASQLKTVKETLRGIPHKGAGFGILRYLGFDAELADALSLIVPEVVFKPFSAGGSQVADDEQTLIRCLGRGAGQAASDETTSSELLSIHCHVDGGELRVGLTFDCRLLSRDAVRRIGEELLGELRGIIRHTTQDGGFGYTPSDFPLATLTQAELDRTLSSMRHVEDVYPLSPLQEGMLFHGLSENSYVRLNRLRVCGADRLRALRRAFDHMIERHEVYRTQMVWEGVSRPHQVVLAPGSVTIPWRDEDWRETFAGLDETERQVRLEARSALEQAEPLNLGRAPLMKITALRIADDVWELLWSEHHILSDGWSLPLLLRDLLLAHEAALQGRELDPGVPDRPKPYRDYIAWLAAQDAAAAETYWRERLAGFDEPTPLAIDKPPRAGAQALQERYSVAVPDEVNDGLAALLRTCQTTMSTVLHGLWGLLLSRYSNRADVVFGSVTSGRPADLRGVEEMVGLFINTVPVRITLRHGERVTTFLRRLHDEMWLQRSQEHAPLSLVQKWSEVESGQNLFQSLLVFQNFPVDPARAVEGKDEGLSFTGGRGSAHYPLGLSGALSGSSLVLHIGYDVSRFEADAIERLGEHLIHLLTGFAAAARGDDRAVADLTLLSEVERRQLLVDWQGKSAVLPEPNAVHRCFEMFAAESPDSVAVDMGDRSMTYGELDRMANRVARHLQDTGVVRGSRVGVCFERSFEMVASVLAVFKAGGVYVPLDPTLPEERLAYMSGKARLSAALGHRATRSALAPLGVTTLIFEELAAVVDDPAPVDVGGSDGAYVIFTSGSTGRPKGVEVSHLALLNVLIGSRAMHPELGRDDGFIAVNAQGFDAAVKEVLWPLTMGARLVLVDDVERRDPMALIQAVKRHRVAVPPVAPSMLRGLAASGQLDTCPSLRMLLTGTEAISMDLVREVFAAVPWLPLRNSYGPTETAVVVCQWKCDPDAERVLIGRPWPNTALFVLDENLSPMPIGVPGELFIAGAQLARGYVDEPGQTAERFLPCPFPSEPGARMYRTGDQVRWTVGGELDFLGRIDHQVKVRGYRIELGEIESTLREHASVEDAVVVATDARGRADKQLVAYVIPTGDVLSIADLREHLGQRLPDYMVPSAFVQLDALPLATSGKLNRNALPAPDEDAFERTDYVAPRSYVERTIAEVWAELLGVDRVGINDNFFALGGHSLLVMQLVLRLHQVLSVQLRVRTVFEKPVLASLAAEASKHIGQVEVDRFEPIKRTASTSAPATAQQVGFLDMNRISPSSLILLQGSVWRLDGLLDADALRRAIRSLFRAHSILRTRFREVDGRWMQFVVPEVEMSLEPLSVFDLRDLARDERQERRDALMRDGATRAFDVGSGVLARFVLIQLADDVHELLVVIHHLGVDFGASRALLSDLWAFYAQQADASSPGPELDGRLQYIDYAEYLAERAKSPAGQADLAYWRERLDRAEPLALPVDAARSDVDTRRDAAPRGVQIFDVHRASVTLPLEIRARLVERAERASANLSAVLVAGWVESLHRMTGQGDVCIQSTLSHRFLTGLAKTGGVVSNAVVLRIDASAGGGFEALVSRVQKAMVEGYEHGLVGVIDWAPHTIKRCNFNFTRVLRGSARQSETDPGDPSLEFDAGGHLRISRSETDGPPMQVPFDVHLALVDLGDAIIITLFGNRELFSAKTCRTMVELLEQVLGEMAQDLG